MELELNKSYSRSLILLGLIIMEFLIGHTFSSKIGISLRVVKIQKSYIRLLFCSYTFCSVYLFSLFICNLITAVVKMTQNVDMLIGSCMDKISLLIVYENACNGMLDHHLSGNFITFYQVNVFVSEAVKLIWKETFVVCNSKLQASNMERKGGILKR